jgi:hypothetical protein
VGEFGIQADPISTSEVVALDGKVYQFTAESSEVVIIDVARKVVELFDLQHRMQTELALGDIDAMVVKIKEAIGRAIAKRESEGGRANRVAAQMSRDLIEPKFTRVATAKAEASKVRLTNPSVEVDATGEPDADPARLALVRLILETVAKLGAYQDPNDLPPFAELAAIGVLVEEKHLRPTELAFLYRLAGPPKKFRRTYRLVPSLTEREKESIGKIEVARKAAPVLRYEQYRQKQLGR